MGREFASAAARWVHLARDRRPARARGRLRHQPRGARLVRAARPRPRGSSPTTASCSPTRPSRRSTAPSRTTCTRSSTPRSSTPGSTCSARSRSGSTSPRTSRSTGRSRPELLVRCSSELPFYPGGQEVVRWIAERRYGRVLEVRSQFLHSSDLDPAKPINWKRHRRGQRRVRLHGRPRHARPPPAAARRLAAAQRTGDPLATSSPSVPAPDGAPVPCDTWDNAVLLCEAEHDGLPFPLRIETKRIAPGETNTWTIEVDGTAGSIAYTTKLPKTLRTMALRVGRPAGVVSARSRLAVSAYPTITGAIFEFGFSDAILQMWAAFLDELAHGREGMRQPFHCATPEEAAPHAPPLHRRARVAARAVGRRRLTGTTGTSVGVADTNEDATAEELTAAGSPRLARFDSFAAPSDAASAQDVASTEESGRREAQWRTSGHLLQRPPRPLSRRPLDADPGGRQVRGRSW